MIHNQILKLIRTFPADFMIEEVTLIPTDKTHIIQIFIVLNIIQMRQNRSTQSSSGKILLFPSH